MKLKTDDDLQLVLVPHWVDRAIQNAGEKKHALLEFNLLRSILSKEDVAFYFVTNDILADKIHPFVANSFRLVNLTDRYLYQDMDSRSDRDDLMMAYNRLQVDEVNNVDLFSLYEKPPLQEGKDQLADETALRNNWNLHGFRIEAIQDNVMGFFIEEVEALKGDYDVSPEKALQDIFRTHLKAVDETVKLMLTYFPFEQVAQTPMFSQFTYLSRHGLSV